MPDLRDAYLRVERAEEHFENLKRLDIENSRVQAEATRFETEPEGPVDPTDPNDLKPWLRVHPADEAIPARCRVLVGDIANDLRSALDYLVARLAELDSGTKQDGTQFPIEDTPKGFKRRQGKFLCGLRDSHIAAIERLQPYKGLNWTKQLRRLSNVDKHRELNIVGHTYTSTTEIKQTPVRAAHQCATQMTMKVSLQSVLHIVMDQGHWPLIETLEKIRFHVVQTLQAFEPEFE